jgi:hypothetical protein
MNSTAYLFALPATHASMTSAKHQNLCSTDFLVPKAEKRALPSSKLTSKMKRVSPTLALGIPFANADDAEVEGWINENKPIVDNHTFVDVLRQRTFYIIIDMPLQHASHKFREASLPPPFSYPYGTNQDWVLHT